MVRNRAFAANALRSSDHDVIVLLITKNLDGGGVNDDVDFCPATASPNVKGPQRSYLTVDAAGCSSTQIVAAEGLGNGHGKFGCSISVMDNRVRKVAH